MAEAGGTLLEEFFIRLGVKPSTDGLKHFEGALKSVHRMMEVLGVTAAFELGRRLGAFVERAVGQAAAVQRTSEAIGMSASAINAWSRAAMDGGVQAGEMEVALQGMTRAAGAAEAGFPRFKKLFEQLQIKPEGKDTEQLFTELAGKFQTWDPGKRLAVAGRLEISRELATMMAKEGAEGFGARVSGYKKTALLTDADFAKANQATITFSQFHRLIGQITTLIGTRLAPVIQHIINKFSEWWELHKKDALIKFEAALLVVIWYLRKLYDWVKDVVKTFQGWGRAIDTLFPHFNILRFLVATIIALKLAAWLNGVAVAAKALGIAGGPVAIIVAGILAWISVADQLQDSWRPIMSWFHDKWDGIKKTVKDVAHAILTIPGVARTIDFFTGGHGARDAAAAGEAQRKAEMETNAKMAAINNPASVDPKTGIGVWHILKGAQAAGGTTSIATTTDNSRVTIEQVDIHADKGREADVGDQLIRQVKRAKQSLLRPAQGAAKS